MDVVVLGSGSGGNAMVVRQGEHAILVDAGFSGTELRRRFALAGLDPAQLTGILITHEHDDHIAGLRVFAKRHADLPVYANALTAERLRQQGKGPERMTIFSNGTAFDVGPFTVEAFSVSHDAIDPVGFVLRCGERRVAIATDFGHAGMMVPLKLHGCDVIVLESNHEPELLRQSGRPPPLQQRILGRRGHLSNQAAGELVPRVLGPATRHLVMAHLSRDCNRPELVRQTVTRCLHEVRRPDVVLHIASQDEVLPAIVIPV